MSHGFFESLRIGRQNLMYVHKQYTYYINILCTYIPFSKGEI